MSIAKYNDLKAALRGLGVPVVKGNWVRKKDIASALLVLGSEETFKVYDHTKPASMKSKTVKCRESDLEKCLRKSLSIPENYESKLDQPKNGSWVFKAGGKEYSVTKYMGE